MSESARSIANLKNGVQPDRKRSAFRHEIEITLKDEADTDGIAGRRAGAASYRGRGWIENAWRPHEAACPLSGTASGSKPARRSPEPCRHQVILHHFRPWCPRHCWHMDFQEEERQHAEYW